MFPPNIKEILEKNVLGDEFDRIFYLLKNNQYTRHFLDDCCNTELIQTLESVGLDEDVICLLFKDVFFLIGRIDLLKKIGGFREDYNDFKFGKYINPYRALLSYAMDQFGSDVEEHIIYYIQRKVSNEGSILSLPDVSFFKFLLNEEMSGLICDTLETFDFFIKPAFPIEKINKLVKDFKKNQKISEGVCVIVDIFTPTYTFKEGGDKFRKGTEIDAEKLERIFIGLNYEVIMEKNKTSEEIRKILVDLSKRDHANSESFVSIFCSHGCVNNIYGFDNTCIRIREITELFSSSKCASLSGKPKLFIFNACQVFEDNVDVQHDLIDFQESELICAVACSPGEFAVRSRSKGSFYTQRLIDEMEHSCLREDILTIIRRVGSRFSQEEQTPTVQETLTRSFFI